MLCNHLATTGVLILTIAATSVVRADNDRYFNIDRATKDFGAALHDNEGLSLVKYVDGFKEIRKFIVNIGPIFRLVDSDINTKIQTLDHMIKNPSETAAKCMAYKSVRSAIEFEVEKNLVTDHRGPAVSRILSRLQWALEFVSALLMRVGKMPYNEDTSYAAREVYEETLAKHHSWAVRLIVNLALRTLSNKRSLIKSVSGKHEGVSDEAIDLWITNLAHVTDDLWKAVEKIYADNNLTNM